MGKKWIRGLKTKVGRECSISRGEARLYSEGIQAEWGRGGSHSATIKCNCGIHSGGSHSVTGRDAAGGKLQE